MCLLLVNINILNSYHIASDFRNSPSMSYIAAISSYLPDRLLTNHELAVRFPRWTADRLLSKTGISERRIAAPGETAGDLALKAAQKLLATAEIKADNIDMLLLVTQTPDQALPATACRIHHELGLSKRCGAFDLNQGCSGYIYGLAVADGMITAGIADTVLLLTADTYSKLIHSDNQSVLPLFGDGACATLVMPDIDPKIKGVGPFEFGTDGSGGGFLCCTHNGFKVPLSKQSSLYMDGAAVLTFTLSVVPKALNQYLEKNNLSLDIFDHVLFHQANKFILEKLYAKIGASDKGLISMEKTGNTVSSTIPFVLEKILEEPCPVKCRKVLLCGFGVGLSWGISSIVI